MAGSGYKLFATGDVLTAAQVNTYLQEQTVMAFADSAARTTALSGVLAEGMMSYLRDTNAVQVYNGSAWVAVGGSSPLTTKGDLYGFSTLDARIPIGTNNQVLTADSTQALGLKWAAASTGKLIQIVEGTTDVNTTSTSSTYADTGLTVTITPTLATSKILVFVAQQGCGKASGSTSSCNQIKLMRDSTEISNTGDGLFNTALNDTFRWFSPVSIQKLDSPATTSAVIYKTQFRSVNGSTQVWVNSYTASAPKPLSSIIAIEIGA